MNWRGLTAPGRPLSRFLGLASVFLGGLAATRILFEALFPRWAWLGRPLPALLIAFLLAGLAWWIGRARGRTGRDRSVDLLYLPLALNLLHLFDPVIDLPRSRLIFGASIWLVALLLAARANRETRPHRAGVVLLFLALLPVYLLTMPRSVGRADTFEFQVVVPRLGIAHPTGYPLYMLLGKLFTLIPAGSVAWRLNLGSVVLATAAAILIYLAIREATGRMLPAVLGAALLGFTTTFWSQAIEAEVYALHAVIVSLAVACMIAVSDPQAGRKRQKPALALSFLIGLGLTNHLTTLLLLPPAALALFFHLRDSGSVLKTRRGLLLRLGVLFVIPLFLYAYLPIRWLAVNGELMGFRRFVDWVAGGRFQGALQWNAWLTDSTRYTIVGRLFMDNWGWHGLLLALLGLAYLIARRRRAGVLLVLTWLGFTFYCLNYYVPDLAVFLIPAHLVVAIAWAAGLAAVIDLGLRSARLLRQEALADSVGQALTVALVAAVVSPALLAGAQHWDALDRSEEDGGLHWGKGVLEMPLEAGAVLLTDSEKIAPLYYLQQIEGKRPDLDIIVLPDEAAYRAELDARIGAGQTVYLARFLPGLEGVYHLRSVGPLTEVSRDPLVRLPAEANRLSLDIGPVTLAGFILEPTAQIDANASGITLFWQADRPLTENLYVFLRWYDLGSGKGMEVMGGQHPANNYYPTVAWKPGELVADFHLMPLPFVDQASPLELQVALAVPFAADEDLAWQRVAEIVLSPRRHMRLDQPLRAQLGSFWLTAVEFPSQVRPQAGLPVLYAGLGDGEDSPRFFLLPGSGLLPDDGARDVASGVKPSDTAAVIRSAEVSTELPNGRFELAAEAADGGALCGWLARGSAYCVLGEVEISGAPLPEGATNFDDKFALLSIETSEEVLQPGGQLQVNITWQSLSAVGEDFTVFVQVLDARDRIVGQADTWPVQGTYPTSQWRIGEVVQDPYQIWLDGDLPSGQYRVQVGWYLLADLRRLPVLNAEGRPVDDKVTVPNLMVP